MTAVLDRFYDLLNALEGRPRQGCLLSDCTGRQEWPQRGVYFFRESDEFRAAKPAALRVTRVGTHAIRTASRSTLWQRLHQHRGHADGGGNHRGSIFRLHVGAALLKRDEAESERCQRGVTVTGHPRRSVRASGTTSSGCPATLAR